MGLSGKWIHGIDCDSSVEDAARRSLEPRLAAVARCMPPAAHLAHHDIEHVHRLRVATRRAVAALQLYHGFVSRKPARWLKKRLRKIRRAAGDARDLDVLKMRIEEEHGERFAPVLALITQERQSVQPAIVQIAARCGKNHKFIRKTAKLLDRIGADKSHDDIAPSLAFRDWAADQLANAVQPLLGSTPPRSADAAMLHAFRIQAKALRYTIELLAPVFGPELRSEVYPVVEELQERLGRIQDHVTAQQSFEKWIESGRYVSQEQMLKELVEDESHRMDASVQEFHHWWTDERIDQLRRALHTLSTPTAPGPDCRVESEATGLSPPTDHPQVDCRS
ncbi:MAG TPA: CHAD domain-containing protein [Lacipirellulaceae bacterium]|nr:CHAD domain-containing protein [Lacipirellulaceae bacterium]